MNRSGVRAGDLKRPEYFAQRLRTIVAKAQARFKFEYNVEKEIERYLQEYAPRFVPMIVDGVVWINQHHDKGSKILIEGANAAMLDIDFGTYPYVTSSNPTIGGCITGLGLSPKKLGDVIGVVKAYTTRVGEGPFPSEDKGVAGEELRRVGHEFGTTTGRPRRCGWFDAVILKYTHLLNGYSYLNLTKVDVLDGFAELKIGVAYKYKGQRLAPGAMPADLDMLEQVEVEYETMPGWQKDISGCRSFADLPENCQRYVKRIEELVGVPIRWVGVGPAREALIEVK
jgi:adenylosuccinate synthase